MRRQLQLATARPAPLPPVCRRGFAALPPEVWPAFPVLQQALDAYKAASDAERERLDAALLGAAQMQWVRSATRKSVARGTTWQLYGTATMVQDTWMGDLEAAVANQADAAKKALWGGLLQNLTGADPTATTSIFSKLAYLSPYRGAVIPAR